MQNICPPNIKIYFLWAQKWMRFFHYYYFEQMNERNCRERTNFIRNVVLVVQDKLQVCNKKEDTRHTYNEHREREREEKCFLYLICFFFFELFYFFVCWWWIVSQQQVPLLPLANQLPRVLPVPHLVLVWEEAVVVVVVEAPKWTNPILRSRKLRPRSIPTHDARFAVNKKKQRNKKINELS